MVAGREDKDYSTVHAVNRYSEAAAQVVQADTVGTEKVEGMAGSEDMVDIAVEAQVDTVPEHRRDCHTDSMAGRIAQVAQVASVAWDIVDFDCSQDSLADLDSPCMLLPSYS